MSQTTHYPNPPDYPDEVDVAPVNIYVHETLMFANHDYSCPVCRENHAILDLPCGVMQPCWDCGERYELVRKQNWLQRIFGGRP